MSYTALAGAYDALTVDVQYRRRAQWLLRQFEKAKIPVQDVLDLGCGTGTIACLLAQAGCRVTAVDGSEDMLTLAAEKSAGLSAQPPFFLHQQMQKLRLLTPVDAAVSTLDALNYLTRPQDVQETFRRVFRYLKPGGVFLFDVNSPWKLRRMNGQVWLDEKKHLYCVWRTEFSEKTQICTYWVDLFEERSDGTWERSFEEHRERSWQPEDLRQWLKDAGFSRVKISGDLRLSAPKPEEDRLIFRCEKKF